jgi:hypothetical protein
MRRVPSSHPNSTIHRESDRAAFIRLLLVLSISAVCACGFVLAARQHVLAVRLGYQSEALRQEQVRLKTEQEKIKNERDLASNSGRIIAEAQKQGLQSATGKQFTTGSADREAEVPAIVPSPKRPTLKKSAPEKR